MKPIATEFTYDGHFHRQIRREGMVAIYQNSRTPDGPVKGYEVVKIRESKGVNWTRADGKTIITTDKEVMPPSCEWGINGFSYQADDLEGANRRFEKLLDRLESKAGTPTTTSEPSSKDNTAEVGQEGCNL